MSSSTSKETSSQHRPSSRSTSGKVRMRPIGFGNPALGTYHGTVFTLEESSAPPSSTNRPIVEGAETVERMVAIVDVPPEQVPEGVLNLARSHLPFIDHVRIVIAEETSSTVHVQQEEQLQEQQSASYPSLKYPSVTSVFKEGGQNSLNQSPSASALAVESAASILASDEQLEAQKEHMLEQEQPKNDNPQEKLWLMEEEKASSQRPERTYLVLLELRSEEDAANFVQDLHGKPFTILDPNVISSVHHVIALRGEDGVAVMNPFFASVGLKILPSTLPSLESNSEAPSMSSNTLHLPEDHNCAVCLEHMALDRDRTGEERTSVLTTVCNHTFHLDCLLQCQDSPCPVCRYDHSGLNEALSQCHLCGTTEHNYVCLICGVVSCVGPGTGAAANSRQILPGGSRCEDSCGAGTNDSSIENERESSIQHRFVSSHARQHYDETLHAYALDTETQHVWDFAGGGYVHRIIQNKEDGKLVEVHDPNNTTSQERSVNPGLSEAQEGEVVHRKLEGFASQYYTLLKSQLEQQRIFYEGRLEEIRRDFASAGKAKQSRTQDLLTALRQERKHLGHRAVSLKRRHQKVMDDVAFLKNMNESLEANKAPLKRKIAEAQRQRIEARDMIQMYLPALEEKVKSLMLQLEESSASDVREQAPSANEDRKPASTRK